MSPLAPLLAAADHPLVLHDTVSAGRAAELADGRAEVLVPEQLPDGGSWDAVVLVVTDRTSLRRTAGRPPPARGRHHRRLPADQ